jgi:hypothetical protein
MLWNHSNNLNGGTQSIHILPYIVHTTGSDNRIT